MEKPYSQACENNKDAILQVISHYFEQVPLVLEVGSGTGQHAVYFAKHLPHLCWQPSDRKINHHGMKLWFAEYEGENLNEPLDLDVTRPWPLDKVPAIFSANTLHIMSWPMVKAFFTGVKQHLEPNGYLCIYGPFNFCGEYTSESNERFDHYLQSQDPAMGIRDYVDLEALAREANLMFVEKHEMPANNFILVWQKSVNLSTVSL
jgi:cyclopropane fatty-acyl-phospholipid synthase-like methyltransferase